jgi:rod shape determining protein RodA
MRGRTNELFGDVDRVAVLLYLVLVIMGWMNIYAAVYNEEHFIITDISQKYGKQMIWIAMSLVLAFIILVVHESFYTVFAYGIFVFMLLSNLAVPFLGRKVNGSSSWFRFGDFGIQPAEFMKFATNLALAKYLSNQGVQLEQVKNTLVSLFFIFLPMLIILKLQNETGLALVFVAFILALYREGLSVNFLILGLIATALFVLALLVNNVYLYIIITLICGLSFLFIQRNKNNIIIMVSICIIAALPMPMNICKPIKK